MLTADENDEHQRKALAQAVKLLARREHSRAELALKLRKRGFSDTTVEAVLDECETQGWLDDRRFADIYARQRMEGLYGPVRIMAELQQRGVEAEPESLSAVADGEWRRRAVLAREKRFGLGGELAWEERGRQGRFLAQRGYTMNQIEYALGQKAEYQSDV